MCELHGFFEEAGRIPYPPLPAAGAAAADGRRSGKRRYIFFKIAMLVFRPLFIEWAELTMHIKIIAGWICAAFAFSNAYAQTAETPAESDMQTVKVTGVRDPAMMPYKEAYDLMTRLKSVSDDRFDYVLRVVSSKTKAPIPGLDLALRGENIYEKVPVAPDGQIQVPLIERAYTDNADFVTNQKKGSIGVEFFLIPKLPGDQFKYADVLASVDAGQRALKEVVPWYLRLFIPRVKGVAVCYSEKGQTLQVSGNRQAVRPADSERMEYVGKQTSWCANFMRDEKDLDKDSVITAPAGARLNYIQ